MERGCGGARDSRSGCRAGDAAGRRRRRDGAAGLVGADGQGWPAHGREGSPRRRLRVGRAAGDRAPVDRIARHRRHRHVVLAAQERPRRGVLHRRGRLVARRVARSDQSLRRAPASAIFCLENNQTALSTPLAEQSAVRVFADKAAGYGIPGITIDGTDPEEIAAAFAWAAERARAGQWTGAHRARVDAHVRPCAPRRHALSRQGTADRRGSIRRSAEQGYADREAYEFWAARDPIASYAARLEREGVIEPGDARRVQTRRAGDRRSRGASGSSPRHGRPAERAAEGVFAGEAPRLRVEILDPERRAPRGASASPPSIPDRRSIERGRRFSRRSCSGCATRSRADPRVFVYGEDVGGDYGNAFLLLRPLLAEFGDRESSIRRSRRERCSAWLHRGRAGGRAPDRRDAVQRLRRDRLQSTRQQRRQDPVSLGRVGADGRAHAVGRPSSRGPVPQPEHRALVLSHARLEDRRPVDAARTRAR